VDNYVDKPVDSMCAASAQLPANISASINAPEWRAIVRRTGRGEPHTTHSYPPANISRVATRPQPHTSSARLRIPASTSVFPDMNYR